MEIKNKIAIVTGGASGMGEAVARLLAKQGAHVCILDTSYDQAQAVVQQINGLALDCDVTDPHSVAEGINQVKKHFGDDARICINCAGIAPGSRIVSKQGPMPLEKFSQVIQVNLIGTFNVMRLCTAKMMDLPALDSSDERGIIINTASIAAFEGQIGQVAYSASKGGIVAMTLPAARELAKFGIRVNAIAPGLIATPMLMNMPNQVQQSLSTQLEFPKRFGQPKEFAHLALHLIENLLINGEVIRLDGAVRTGAK